MSASVLLMRFLAALMIAVGAIIAWTCGTCTWEMVSPAFGTFRGTGDELFALLLALLFGVVPTIAGLALIWGGTVIWRTKDKGGK